MSSSAPVRDRVGARLMTVRTVLTYPNPLLEVTAHPVDAVDDEIRALIVDLFDTMYAQGGVGLAATQIGDDRRVVVVDCRDAEGKNAPLALVNPQIIGRQGEVIWREGCLSVPGVTAEVDRAAEVSVTYLDAENIPQELTADGLLAVCIQHELDHLDGTLYVDRLGRLERESVLIEYAALDRKPPVTTTDQEEKR